MTMNLGDWEADHEEYVKQFNFLDPSKLQTSNESWQENDRDIDRSFSLPYDIEESIDKLVTDEVEYIDPAILNVSKKKQLQSPNLAFESTSLFPAFQGSIGKIWDSSGNAIAPQTPHASVLNGNFNLPPNKLEIAQLVERCKLDMKNGSQGENSVDPQLLSKLRSYLA
ncbi:hypothetical protein Ciccas_001713 [Cichlidogyrus casuarinus]|uniref:Uncharacterized protein n=1 Tax=Cichlidogyrus casuarinus TaxID=1844966 RepID=A0ABD2QJC4_9PLAT